jgi:hypothetical protein
MYLQDTVTGDALAGVVSAPKPFGPGFTAEQARVADSMEVWCSDMSDAVEQTRFELMRDGKVIATAVIAGY